MGSIVQSYNLFLDSKYRKSGPNYHPEFEIDPQIVLTDPNNFLELELVSADLPFSFHMIAAPSNTVNVNFTSVHHSLNQTRTLTIPPGNYSILDLNSELITQYIAALVALGFSNPNQRPELAIDYDRNTNGCTFYFASVPNDDWTVTFYWTTADIMAEYFGFDYTQNTILACAASVATYTHNVSVNVVNVNPITSLYLRSNMLAQPATNQEILVEPVPTTANILAKLPVNFASMTWLFYESNGTKVRLHNNELSKFDLFFTALTYDEIRFRGAHWKVHIRIQEIQPDAIRDLLQAKAAAAEQAKAQLAVLQEQKRQLTDQTEQRMAKIRKRIQTS